MLTGSPAFVFVFASVFVERGSHTNALSGFDLSSDLGFSLGVDLGFDLGFNLGFDLDSTFDSAPKGAVA